MGGLRRRRHVRYTLRKTARLGPPAPIFHLGVPRGPRDLLRTRVGGHHPLKYAGQEQRQLPRAAARVPREPLRGSESRQEVAEPWRIGWAMSRVGGRHVGEVILEALRRRHRSSSQVSETRSLPKLWFFSLRVTRKPAALYRRRAAESSLCVQSVTLR